MNTINQQILDQTSLSITDFLAPISEQAPVGEDLHYDKLYQNLKKARTEGDPNIPLIHDEEELEKADWVEAASLCIEGLTNQSKDLQLAAWLLEANLNRYGLAALAPGLFLIEQLAITYWPTMYPLIGEASDEPDYEHRDNLFSWLETRLRQLLHLMPINSDPEHFLNWQVMHGAALTRNQTTADNQHQENGPTWIDCEQYLAKTPTQDLIEQLQAIDAGIIQLDEYNATLTALRGDDQPSVQNSRDLLTDIGNFLYETLEKRGIVFDQPTPDDAADDPSHTAEQLPPVPYPDVGALQNRDHAYQQLTSIGHYLANIDPHSPVPIMVDLLVRWGQMDAGALYQELFIEGEGKVDLVKVIGGEG